MFSLSYSLDQAFHSQSCIAKRSTSDTLNIRFNFVYMLIALYFFRVAFFFYVHVLLVIGLLSFYIIYHVLMAGGGSFLVYAGIAALLFFSIPVMIMLGYIVSCQEATLQLNRYLIAWLFT